MQDRDHRKRSMGRAAALELAGVTKRYGTSVAVDNISLKIAAGTYCCLLGPSGCGKSSTLRMIAGHEHISVGDIGRIETGRLRPYDSQIAKLAAVLEVAPDALLQDVGELALEQAAQRTYGAQPDPRVRGTGSRGEIGLGGHGVNVG